MKYNFMKLLQEGGITPPPASGVLMITKPAINLNNIERQTRLNSWQTKASLDWMTNGQYDYAKMYAYYQQHPEEFGNISSITATPNFEGAKTNDRGYLQWNLLFNQTGLNKFFGYDEGVADYYGPTTAARAGFIDYINKQPPQIPPETPPETPPEIPPVPSETPSETPLETTSEEIPPIPQKPDPTPWTDWIPLSAQLGNDLMSAERQAALQKQMRFPLIEGPFLQHKITNNYHLRTGMQQNANELRDLAAFRSNSSDLRANMDNMHKYDTQASQIENQAEQIKADTVFKERQISENVENTNKKTGADVANYNAKQNAAAWNNILDANAKRDLRRTAALNSWIGNMYTSHGEWLKDQRLNDQQYLRGLNQYNANLKQQKAYQDYYDLASDYTKSQAYQDFIDAVDNSSGNDISDFDSDRYNDTNRRDAYLKELWIGDSDLAKQYRNRYDTEISNAERQYYQRMQQINNRLEALNLVLPARISNQGIYINPNISPSYFPRYARGGSVRARFIDYQNHIQKEQQKQKELQHKRNQLVSKQLNADLDRLSKEQMILLRSVFK